MNTSCIHTHSKYLSPGRWMTWHALCVKITKNSACVIFRLKIGKKADGFQLQECLWKGNYLGWLDKKCIIFLHSVGYFFKVSGDDVLKTLFPLKYDISPYPHFELLLCYKHGRRILIDSHSASLFSGHIRHTPNNDMEYVQSRGRKLFTDK